MVYNLLYTGVPKPDTMTLAPVLAPPKVPPLRRGNSFGVSESFLGGNAVWP
jgi:hypothetical protein